MSKYKEIKAALLGAGTVGGGVYKLVERRAAEMPDKVGGLWYRTQKHWQEDLIIHDYYVWSVLYLRLKW